MRHRSAAFTFLEIMIVMVIIGIVMAVALPRLKGVYGRTRLTTAARDVTALMRFGRDMAVLTETQSEIRLDPDNNQYQLAVYDRDGKRVKIDARRARRRDDESNPLHIGADMLAVKTLPKQVHFQAIYTAADLSEDTNLPMIVFYADGSASPATVALQDDEKRTIRVEIYRTTGMTRVESGLPPATPAGQQKLYYGPDR